jgi:subtilase family serine protease
VLVEAFSAYDNDLASAELTAGRWPGVKQISNSWGGAGQSQGGSAYTFPGIAVLAGAGDWGTAQNGNVFYPAAYPGVNAVGGTSLATSSGTPVARGFSESAWALSNGWGGGSGCNTQSGITKPSYQTDTGCTGRSYADVSADADPNTGILTYDSGNGGWFATGGTSLASPLTAAYLAVTGIDGSSPGWAYANSALLNDPVSGSTGSCSIYYICNAGVGYDGPTGAGSISGDLVTGATGIGGPPVGSGGSSNTYMQSVNANAATMTGGIYPNGLSTTYYWQYGTTTSYGQQSAPQAVAATRARPSDG